jgi:predicted metal-dependent hydrolase
VRLLDLFHRHTRESGDAGAIDSLDPRFRGGDEGGWWIEVSGRRVTVELKPNPRARRVTLRADAARGVIRLSLCPRTPALKALALLDTHRDWIGARVAAWPRPLPFAPGATVPVEGRDIVIDWSLERARSPELLRDRLLVGGPIDGLAGRVERFLRARAKAVLTAETRETSAMLGKPVAAIAVRDTASRWGSCSSSARIAYSWRLILAPPHVRRYVVAHEVAHLAHLDHGPAFWTLTEALYGHDVKAARRWLKRHGPALHWIGRS